MPGRRRIALVVGHFDWFSGYQETALARALGEVADVEVVASDRVSPIFGDAHIEALGVPRRYEPRVDSVQGNVRVSRFRSSELRAMVWSWAAVRHLRSRQYDLVIQVMPGQGLPVAPSLTRRFVRRVALYGDNSAMYAGLSPWKRKLKWLVFSITKGPVYRLVNRRAVHIFGYTPETIRRLRRFQGKTPSSVLPLSFDPDRFYYSEAVRSECRRELGYDADELVVLSAGKMVPEKRLESLLDAVSHMAKANRRVRLLMVGADESAYASSIKQLVADDTLLRSVTQFLGFQESDRLNALMNAADIGVWPHQPAITIQQAMGTGLAVLLPKNDLVGHLVGRGGGIYYGPEAPHRTLRHGLNAMLEDENLHVERSQRASENSWLSSDGIARSLLLAVEGDP